MSLVIAFVGREGAIMAGDMREVMMKGPDAAIFGFEQELYSGQIRTESDLRKRAVEMGVVLHIRDDKCKVSDHGGILIGEVTESDGVRVRKRRLCAASGTYAIVDIIENAATLKQEGQGSTFVVLGNEVTKRISHEMIQSEWKNGTFPDAVRLIIRIMDTVASCTPSVSRSFAIVQTQKKADPATMEIMKKTI